MDLVQYSLMTSVERMSTHIYESVVQAWQTIRDRDCILIICNVQTFQPDDYDLCAQFCLRILVCCWILHCILFIDEALFSWDRINNTSNSHLQSTDNPHGTFESTFQYKFSVNVGCGLVGTFILKQLSTAANYMY
jgi:hypothetical protein